MAIVASGVDENARVDEKAGRFRLGSQKTYQRVACSSPRGTEAGVMVWRRRCGAPSWPLVILIRKPLALLPRGLNR